MLEVIKLFVKRMLMGKGKGILQIPPQKAVDDFANDLFKKFKQNGVPNEAVNNANDVKAIWNQITNREAQIMSNNMDDMRNYLIKNQNNSTKIRLPEKSAEVFDLKGRKIKNPQNIMGGEEIIETDAQILKRLKKQNEDSINRLKNKKDPEDPQKFYQGGQAEIQPDLSDIGHGSDALMARNALLTPGSQATTSTGLNYLLGEDNDTTRVPYKEKGSVSLLDFIKVNASGTKSGKNQIQGAPKGITVDNQTINAIIDLDIPINEKINILGSYAYGKGRSKIEKGDEELFLDEGGYKDRNIGLGFNQDGEGLSGSVIRNLETGDNDYQLKFLKKFADGGRIPYEHGDMVLPKEKPMDEYMLKQVLSPAGIRTLDPRTREMFIEIYKKKIREKNSKADGGRTAFQGGGSDASTTSFSQSFDNQHGTNTASRANKTVDARQAAGQRDADRTNDRISNTELGRRQDLNNYRAINNPKPSTLENIYNTGSEINYLNNLYKMNPVGLGISYGINKYGPSLMNKLKTLRSEADLEEDQNGIMKMAELSQTQLDYLNTTKTQRDLKEGFLTPQQIYDKLPSYEEKTPLNPFKGDQEPTTPQEFNEYLDTIDKNKYLQRITVAQGGPARQKFGLGRRAFLKWMASGAAGIGAAKSGLFSLLKGGGKKQVVEEVIKQSAGSGTPPAYFFNLVKKIKNLGDEVTETAAIADRQKVTKFKDFELTEDLATGEKTIQRYKLDEGNADAAEYYGKSLTEETYMSYKPGETIIGKNKKPIKTPSEYEEGTAYLRNDRGNTGEIVEESATISDDVIKEGTVFEDTLSEFGKADGGRIGYGLGSKVIGKGIAAVTKKAGEGKFTKNQVLEQMFKNTIKGTKDANTKKRFLNFIEEIKLKPELSKDPNVWNFFTKGMPKNQRLVVYGDDTVDFWRQSEFGPHNIATSAKFQKKHPYLTKDQAVKIQNMEPEDQIFEMKKLEAIRKRTANATGGRVPMLWGGGIFKTIITNLAKARGVNPSEYLRITNYKAIPDHVKKFMPKADFEKMKAGRIEMFENWVDMAKSRKEFLRNIEEGKKSPSAPIFEHLEQSFKSPVPSSVTDKDILQGEFILKNLKTKDRKLHSSGGIAAMLGE